MSVELVADLIRQAMLELGAIASGDNPSDSEYDDGVDSINLMLQTFSGDESLLPRRSYEFTVSTSGIPIGPASTLVTTGRVLKILAATLRYGTGANAVDYPLAVGQWPDYQRLQNKSVGGYPCAVFLNPGTLATGTIYFDRVPDAGYTLLLDTLELFGTYANESAAINLPGEYKPFLKWNLAVTLSNQYPGLTPFIASEARKSREAIQRLNHKYLMPEPMPLTCLVV